MRRPTILLTGTTGQLGRALHQTLALLGEVVAVDRQAMDLAQADAIRLVIHAVRPDVIVNAAAYTAVDRAESEPDQAMAINGTAPEVMAEAAVHVGAALVHYSTDYVFDGSGTRPWREDDQTAPLNVYGRTKLAGEQAIVAVGGPALIVRTSWVYGLHGDNFVTTMLRLGRQRECLSVVADQVGAPTSARVVADVTGQILAHGTGDLPGLLRERGGVVHVSCAGETSRHGFAEAIFRVARLYAPPLLVSTVHPLATDEYPAQAQRPANSRLDCRRLSEWFSVRPPTWDAALEQFFQDGAYAKAPVAGL